MQTQLDTSISNFLKSQSMTMSDYLKNNSMTQEQYDKELAENAKQDVDQNHSTADSP